MTTIAVRDGIIAADSNLSSGGTRAHPSAISKLIVGRRHRAIYAGAGAFATVNSAIHALERLKALPWEGKVDRECDLSLGDDSDLLVATKDGVFVFEGSGWFRVDPRSFYALGSGETAALAAMWCGKSAVEAVEIACKLDIHTFPPICSMSVPRH